MEEDTEGCLEFLLCSKSLIKLVYEETVHILLHMFVSKKFSAMATEFKQEEEDTNLLCFVAEKFEEWLINIGRSGDM